MKILKKDKFTLVISLLSLTMCQLAFSSNNSGDTVTVDCTYLNTLSSSEKQNILDNLMSYKFNLFEKSGKTNTAAQITEINPKNTFEASDDDAKRNSNYFGSKVLDSSFSINNISTSHIPTTISPLKYNNCNTGITAYYDLQTGSGKEASSGESWSSFSFSLSPLMGGSNNGHAIGGGYVYVHSVCGDPPVGEKNTTKDHQYYYFQYFDVDDNDTGTLQAVCTEYSNGMKTG